jgi:branched-chain amino acid transport system substrate-binding protein
MSSKPAVYYLIMIPLIMIIGGLKSSTSVKNIRLDSSTEIYINKTGNREEEIKIGLLLPTMPEKDPLALAAQQGAQLAINIANENGGYRGKPFRVITRKTEGLWGAGSKESVKLVYEDEVVAIITALDGRNAHLAEQVATKSHVVQLATRATDETLSQAFVPWFFRIVPSDKQQSEVLIEEIYQRQELSKIQVIYENVYDHSKGSETFSRLIRKEGLELSGMSVIPSTQDLRSLSFIIPGVEAVVIFGSFTKADPVLKEIKKTYPEIQVFGSLAMTADGSIGSEYSAGCEGGIFVSSRFCYTTNGKEFKNKFVEYYDHMPNPAASYAFDGVNLIVEAVREAGPDREKIREVLERMNYISGVTGTIKFDQYGNRTSPVFLIRMIKGHPVILHP